MKTKKSKILKHYVSPELDLFLSPVDRGFALSEELENAGLTETEGGDYESLF